MPRLLADPARPAQLPHVALVAADADDGEVGGVHHHHHQRVRGPRLRAAAPPARALHRTVPHILPAYHERVPEH